MIQYTELEEIKGDYKDIVIAHCNRLIKRVLNADFIGANFDCNIDFVCKISKAIEHRESENVYHIDIIFADSMGEMLISNLLSKKYQHHEFDSIIAFEKGNPTSIVKGNIWDDYEGGEYDIFGRLEFTAYIECVYYNTVNWM